MNDLVGPSSNKRRRFIIFTLLSAVYIYLVTFRYSVELFYLTLGTVLFTLAGSFYVNRPNINFRNILLSVVLPFSSLFGTILFLISFSNFTLAFQLFVIFGFMMVYYPILLSLNIFLVVAEEGSIIPLYRVASTWNQILLSLVSIPLFAGILKLNLYSIYIAMIFFTITFIFSLYNVWSIRLAPDSRKTRVGDVIIFSAFSGFIVFCFVVALSFLPSEAFLISLTASSVLMFVLTYIGGYLRNDITKKQIINNALIILFFIVMTALLS